MGEKLVSTVIAALVGGIVGAGVVLLLPGKPTFDTLEVGNLTITGQATLLDKDGKEDIVFREGSVLARNIVLGKKFIGTQFQGHVFVGNNMFTSPDDLVATPMEQWRFFTEIRSSDETGGEMIVRSPNGANIVGQPVNSGNLIRTGFDKSDQPQMFLHANKSGTKIPVGFVVPQRNEAKDRQTADAPPTEPKPASVATDPTTPKPQ